MAWIKGSKASECFSKISKHPDAFTSETKPSSAFTRQEGKNRGWFFSWFQTGWFDSFFGRISKSDERWNRV